MLLRLSRRFPKNGLSRKATTVAKRLAQQDTCILVLARKLAGESQVESTPTRKKGHTAKQVYAADLWENANEVAQIIGVCESAAAPSSGESPRISRKGFQPGAMTITTHLVFQLFDKYLSARGMKKGARNCK
jgi:hypothetical protein